MQHHLTDFVLCIGQTQANIQTSIRYALMKLNCKRNSNIQTSRNGSILNMSWSLKEWLNVKHCLSLYCNYDFTKLAMSFASVMYDALRI